VHVSHAERFVRSIKDECLSRVILFGNAAGDQTSRRSSSITALCSLWSRRGGRASCRMEQRRQKQQTANAVHRHEDTVDRQPLNSASTSRDGCPCRKVRPLRGGTMRGPIACYPFASSTPRPRVQAPPSLWTIDAGASRSEYGRVRSDDGPSGMMAAPGPALLPTPPVRRRRDSGA
jgi:hypothetical protein